MEFLLAVISFIIGFVVMNIGNFLEDKKIIFFVLKWVINSVFKQKMIGFEGIMDDFQEHYS